MLGLIIVVGLVIVVSVLCVMESISNYKKCKALQAELNKAYKMIGR